MEKESSKKLVEEISSLSSDDEYVELYTKLSRKEMEQNTFIYEAKEQGYKSGYELGHKSGVESEKIKIAKSMLKDNVNIEVISKYIGLSSKEISNISLQ